MRGYLVSYDLLKPGQDYAGLIERLKQFGAVRVMLSQWALRTSNWTAMELCTDLRKHVDANDRLLISRLTEAAWTSLLVPDQKLKDIAA